VIPVKAVLSGAAATLLGTMLLIAILGFAQEPETEPGPVLVGLSWVLGTLVRAGGGYLAARMSVRTGARARVAGAGAGAGAVGYAAFLALMVTLAALGGDPGFTAGDVLGLPLWTAQAALGGALAAVLHRGRIAEEARTSSWAYG
jgi:hypothetical protein